MGAIDFECCKGSLDLAYRNKNRALGVTLEEKKRISFIITNTHITYKYILLNALLGRSCMNVNPLVLQKLSKLKDSWDARTLCHKVVVPFEKDVLQQRLGGSNEPFLNKPARFPELALTNAVRRGNDLQILKDLITLLSGIKSKKHSFDLLSFCLREIKKCPLAVISTSTAISTSEVPPINSLPRVTYN
jgi:hypothetical protein